MAPETPREPAAKGKGGVGFDLIDHLDRFLAGPGPQTLLINGPSGSGKSTLIRALLPRLKGRRLFVAYRTEPGAGTPDSGAAGDPMLSFLVVDPNAPRVEPSRDPISSAGPMMSFAPAALPRESAFPPALIEAMARLATDGGGYVVTDSWDTQSEAEFRKQAGPEASVQVVSATSAIMRAKFGRIPICSIVALAEVPDSEMESAADGVVQLGWEDLEGFRLRVVSIPKLRSIPTPETRYLYTLDGGRFYCPPQLPPGFRPPIGPPDPDPQPEEDSLFPGSQSFCDAFGRLRYHGLTGFQVPQRFSGIHGDVVLYPLVAHVLSIGGRAVWIPAAASSAGQIISQMSRWIPPDFLRERLRIVTPWGPDPALGDLKSVALPIRRAPDDGRDARSVVAPGVGPVFPESFRFLQGTPEGRPQLYVIHIDGVRALASIAGVPLDPESFPLIVSGYTRLSRFHGLGFGRVDDPVVKVLAGAVDTLIQIEERYGRSVLLGLRPRTSPYILDWAPDSGRYVLTPIK
jgi:hypothetical protein